MADALRVFAWLSIIGGIIWALFSFEFGVVAIGFGVAGLLYGVLLFGCAAVIDLLRVIAAGGLGDD